MFKLRLGLLVNNRLSPILMFVYARPDHAKRTIESLASNYLASESDLIIYSDGPKSIEDIKGVEAVRQLLPGIIGFKSVTIITRSQNFGLSKSIISGLNDQLMVHDSVIIVEDDLIFSRFFLKFMNDGLNFYRYDVRVASIQGYVFPGVSKVCPQGFFLLGADCWGWATWKRAWSLFDANGDKLFKGLLKNKLTKKFDFGGQFPYVEMLHDQIHGKNDSWAIRWYAATFLAGVYSFYPPVSLVKNIGNDGTGTNKSDTDVYSGHLGEEDFRYDEYICIEDSTPARIYYINFYKNLRSKKFFQQNISLRLIKIIKSIYIYFRQFLVLISNILTPPFLLKLIKRIKFSLCPPSISYFGPYQSWDSAKINAIGYSDPKILEKTINAVHEVLDGRALYERDSVPFREYKFSMPISLGLLKAAVLDAGCLRVLDIGGGFASSFYSHYPLLCDIRSVQWCIVEQERVVHSARPIFIGPIFKFYTSVKAALEDSIPNVILFSASLQYFENPYDILELFDGIDPSLVIIIDRLPVHKGNFDLFSVQKISPEIYDSSYPLRIFSEPALIGRMKSKWLMLYSELSPEGVQMIDRKIEFSYKGYVFCRRK